MIDNQNEQCCHDHGQDHDCSCHDGVDLDTIFLVFEDENQPGQEVELECGVLGIFDHADREYIAIVVPEGDEGDLEDLVYIYQYMEDEEGLPVLINIEDDEEHKAVEETFIRLFMEEE